LRSANCVQGFCPAPPKPLQEVMGWRQDSKARPRLWPHGGQGCKAGPYRATNSDLRGLMAITGILSRGSRRPTKPKLYDLIGRTEIFSGFRRALCLGLRVADSFGEHLAKLGLSLWRFAREGFCPCRHEQYVGMPKGELNPDVAATTSERSPRITKLRLLAERRLSGSLPAIAHPFMAELQ
jgi:hypothetical protein